MIIAIIRLRQSQPSGELLGAIAAGGVSTIEVTLPTPGALDLLASGSEYGVRLGAGTVRDRAGAASARDAGAKFFVTPTFDPDVLDVAYAAGIPVYCGAATPTEIEMAYRHPAVEGVKVFPAGALGGPSFVKAVREPLDNIPLIPTGGVTPELAREYLKLGCVGVGVGSALVSEEAVADKDWQLLESRAQEFANAWSN